MIVWCLNFDMHNCDATVRLPGTLHGFINTSCMQLLLQKSLIVRDAVSQILFLSLCESSQYCTNFTDRRVQLYKATRKTSVTEVRAVYLQAGLVGPAHLLLACCFALTASRHLAGTVIDLLKLRWVLLKCCCWVWLWVSKFERVCWLSLFCCCSGVDKLVQI